MLARNPTDAPALRKTIALARARKFKEALATARQRTPPCRGTSASSSPRCSSCGRCRRRTSNCAYAQSLAAGHPEDPAFELIQAMALSMTKDPQASQESFRRVAGRSITDPELAMTLMDCLDSTGQFAAAQAVAERTAALRSGSAHHPGPGEPLVAAGQWQRIVDYLGQAKAARPAETQLTALHATALLQLGRTAEADALLKGFSARPDDAEAMAWLEIIPACFGKEPAKPGQMLKTCQDALSRAPANPFFSRSPRPGLSAGRRVRAGPGVLGQDGRGGPGLAGPVDPAGRERFWPCGGHERRQRQYRRPCAGRPPIPRRCWLRSRCGCRGCARPMSPSPMS